MSDDTVQVDVRPSLTECMEIMEIVEIVEKIKPMLRGRGPGVQGAVLLELTSKWIAGHHPKIRTEIWQGWTDAVLNMVEPQEEEIFLNRERPEGWHL